jgi:2,3-bisphosphoglycerate-dependent phosphoglycerate mutase
MLNKSLSLTNIVFKKRFFIVRHGESIWNQDSKFTGWTNIPLTENGKKEASNVADVLKKNNLIPTIIFSSVLNRAIDTSNIIKKELNKNIEIHTSWRLNEKHYGTLEGIPRNYIRDVYGDKFTKMMRSNFSMKPPILKNYDTNNSNTNNSNVYSIYKNCYLNKVKNGESKENVLERLLPYYENDILYTISENNTPLIVTHKHCARVLMKYLLKINDEEFENYELPNKKIIMVDLDDNLNYKTHSEISY